MPKSRLKDFTQYAKSHPTATPTEELILEAEVTAIETLDTKEDEALRIVKRNMGWAMALGLMPMPIVDIMIVTGFQARTIKELSDLYGVPFSKHRVKNVAASLISGIGSTVLGQLVSRSFLKSIPLIGSMTSIAALPLVIGGITYAVGKVFIQHFESGGTFLNFDPQAVRDYFKKQFEEGMKISSQMVSNA